MSSVETSVSHVQCLGILADPSSETHLLPLVAEAARRAGIEYHPYVPDESSAQFRPPEVVLARTDLVVGIGETPQHPSFELGVARGMGKPLILVGSDDLGDLALGSIDSSLATDFHTPHVTYSEGADDVFIERLTGVLQSFIADPESFLPRFPQTPLPSPDFDRLDPREFENLCFELMTQLGFRRADWGGGPDIDLVASLPKSDPDGFRYEELWLCSLGFRMPLEVLLDMASSDPDFFLNRMVDLKAPSASHWAEAPVTFLAIIGAAETQSAALHELVDRVRVQPRSRVTPRLRVRVWDPQTLQMLLSRHPQLVAKYFGDFDRAQSRYRKSIQELYDENVELVERLQLTVDALEEERDRRVRAERDAVWKDVAFTAAHKLGNPIFALETDLLSLNRALDDTESNVDELVSDMGATLEKAKRLIAQFKSLTKVREISLRPIDVIPLLSEAARVAERNGVAVSFDTPEGPVLVLGDAGFLSECFDELIHNSLRWLPSTDRSPHIAISVARNPVSPQEPVLQSGVYVHIRIADNGPGISADDRERIFVPFFTTDLQDGTGMGLPQIQRTIEAHNGTISETGTPGEGACFDIRLPAPATVVEGGMSADTVTG